MASSAQQCFTVLTDEDGIPGINLKESQRSILWNSLNDGLNVED